MDKAVEVLFNEFPFISSIEKLQTCSLIHMIADNRPI